MTVFEICELLTDTAVVEIFSFEKGETIYKGYNDEIPDRIGEQEVTSIDSVFPETKHLTINIECVE